MTTRGRSLATAIRRSPILNAIINSPSDAVAFTEALNTATDGAIGGGSESVATAADLPLSGNEVGDFAFVQETNRLYLWNGQGWYNIALINTSPSFTAEGSPSSNYVLDSNGGSPLIIQLEANDPEDVEIQWSYLASDSADYFATIQQTDNTFTITSKPQEVIEQYSPTGGSFSITFKASDGVNIVPAISTFRITISIGNVYIPNLEFPKNFRQSPSLEPILQSGNYSGELDINYDGTAIVTGTGASNPVPGNSAYTGDGGLAFLYKVNDSWVRTANGQHWNYNSISGDARWGDYGCTISHDGKRAISVSDAYVNTDKHNTWYEYYYDYISGVPADGTDKGNVSFTPVGFPSTQNTTNTSYITSPMVKELGSRYSYGVMVTPFSKYSTNSSVGQIHIIKCDEESTTDGFSVITKTASTAANYRHGEGGASVSYQGDRLVYATRSRFDYFSGTAGSFSTTITANSLSSIGGISASSIYGISNAYYRMRFDVNKKFYLSNGSRILIFDLSAGLVSDFDTWEEIDLTVLLPVSTSGDPLTWNLSNFDAFSVTYNGDYIMVLNNTNKAIYVLHQHQGQWMLNSEILATSGTFLKAAMSGDGSTIVGRTNTNEIFVYDVENPG